MPTVVEELPLADLAFDPDNPRLPRSIDGREQAEVLRWMLDDATIVELMESIGSQGYFAGEPLLVTRDESVSPARFAVIEGNRRLAALKLLGQPGLAPIREGAVSRASEEAAFRPSDIPSISFASRDEVLDYLGYRHVTGVKEWGPLAKARYLASLASRDALTRTSEDLTELARRVGAGRRTDYVRRLLTTLDVYDFAFDRDFFGLGITEEDVEFAVLSTAIGYSTIAEFVGITGDATEFHRDNLKDLLAWLFVEHAGAKVVAESRRLRELADVVAVDGALEVLRATSNLEEAHTYTAGPLEAFRLLLSASRLRLSNATNQLARIEGVTEEDILTLTEIFTLARDLRAVVRARLTETEDDG